MPYEQLPAILSVLMMAIIFLAALLLDNHESRRLRTGSQFDSLDPQSSDHQLHAHPLPQQTDMKRN